MSRCLRYPAVRMALGLAAIMSIGAATLASAAGPTARTAVNNPIAYNVTRGLGPVNAPPGPGFTTVLARFLPRGRFVMWAKVTVTTSVSTGSDCRLLVGAVEVDSSSQSPFNSSVTARTTHPLQAARNLTGGIGSRFVRLQCRAGALWTADAAKFTALRVNAFG